MILPEITVILFTGGLPYVQCTKNRLTCENCTANYKIFPEHKQNSRRFPGSLWFRCSQSSRDADARDQWTRSVTGSTCCRSVHVLWLGLGLRGADIQGVHLSYGCLRMVGADPHSMTRGRHHERTTAEMSVWLNNELARACVQRQRVFQMATPSRWQGWGADSSGGVQTQISTRFNETIWTLKSYVADTILAYKATGSM